MGQQKKTDGVRIDVAQRAVDRAFSTGKADRASITRQAQLDAAEAVAMAGIAMESDEAADEAARLTIIAANMGDKQKTKTARERERVARNKAKTDHAAATKSAKQAYDAIKFSDPTKLGFVRVVQIAYLGHIVGTLLALILTSRDTVVYSSVNIVDWVMVVLESVAFYFFVNRFKIGRPFVIGMSIIGIVTNVVTSLVQGNFSVFGQLGTNAMYIFLALYFAFSSRVKAVLVNDLSHDKGAVDTSNFVIERSGWPFIRNLIIYFVVFSILGHWMEAGMCQFIRLGWVQGDYDLSNTMLWRDWLYPYPMEGAAVVFIALFLYPLFIWLKEKYTQQRWVAYLISFLANALTCTVIEFFSGLVFNAHLQNWDYTNNFCNIMGQVCLQNTIAFGVAASLIAWYVYPALERLIARVKPSTMNIVCVVVAVAGSLLFALYAIAPPEGIDFGEGGDAHLERVSRQERATIELSAVDIVDDIEALQDKVNDYTSLTKEERAQLQKHLDALKKESQELQKEAESLDKTE